MAGAAFSRRDVDGDGHGLFRERDQTRRRAGALRAPDYLERRKLRLAGCDAGHSSPHVGRGNDARLVANYASGSFIRPGARFDSWGHWFSANNHLVLLLEPLRFALAAGG